mmetsp:Transcript_46522/g.135511  ORF Transcript_46522/g.135511 Transcript_46522/m.135511 type:complete len:242 (-) Transcript_46522:100-825(-)
MEKSGRARADPSSACQPPLCYTVAPPALRGPRSGPLRRSRASWMQGECLSESSPPERAWRRGSARWRSSPWRRGQRRHRGHRSERPDAGGLSAELDLELRPLLQRPQQRHEGLGGRDMPAAAPRPVHFHDEVAALDGALRVRLVPRRDHALQDPHHSQVLPDAPEVQTDPVRGVVELDRDIERGQRDASADFHPVAAVLAGRRSHRRHLAAGRMLRRLLARGAASEHRRDRAAAAGERRHV